MGLLENYNLVRAKIAMAAQQAGRDPASVQLVAVSKGQPLEAIAALYAAGQRDFGENRVPAALDRLATTRAFTDPLDPIRWHFIGNIQSRKAKTLITGFTLLHSVDRLELALALQRQAEQNGVQVPILLECNVSGEASKHGFAAATLATDPNAWQSFCEMIQPILACQHLKVRGLMTMAPATATDPQAFAVFSKLAQLRQHLAAQFGNTDWSLLSMGMSHDYPAAIAAGATLVRVGSAIFSEAIL